VLPGISQGQNSFPLVQQGFTTPENQRTGEFSQIISDYDQQHTFITVKSSCRKIFNKQKQAHICKFSILNNQQNRSTPVLACNELILKLSEHSLTDSEEVVLIKF
jgi:hypothetical protein